MQSEWNMAISTLQRIDQGIRICNEGLYICDTEGFSQWLKGLYHLYGELSTWMKAAEQKAFLALLQPCKSWRGTALETNLDNYLLATQSLRRTAHKNKLLLKEAEDTAKHGG